MKLYDKIFSIVPSNEIGGKYAVVESKPMRLQEHDDFIVLSIEELKNFVKIVWDEAQFSLSKDNGEDMSDVENEGDIAKSASEFLSTYLQSKGITIKQ